VIEVGDGIARIHGLGQATYSELLQFPHDITGLALNLEEDNVGAVILGDGTRSKREMKSKRPVESSKSCGEALVGRWYPWAVPGRERTIKAERTRPVERVAPTSPKGHPSTRQC